MTERRRAQIWFFLGILAVLIMGIPYIILGQDAIFVYHDQLDGEVIAYLLKARHLWDGQRYSAGIYERCGEDGI